MATSDEAYWLSAVKNWGEHTQYHEAFSHLRDATRDLDDRLNRLEDGHGAYEHSGAFYHRFIESPKPKRKAFVQGFAEAGKLWGIFRDMPSATDLKWAASAILVASNHGYVSREMADSMSRWLNELVVAKTVEEASNEAR